MRKEWKQWQVNENPLLIIQASKSNFRIMQIAHYCNITCMHVAATSETLKEIDNTIDRFLWMHISKIQNITNHQYTFFKNLSNLSPTFHWTTKKTKHLERETFVNFHFRK